MKSYSVQPDLTSSGLRSLAKAIRNIRDGKAKRVDLGHGTIVYAIPSQNPKKFTLRVDMEIEEEEVI